MGNSTLARSILIPIFTCFCVFAASCTPTPEPTESPISVSSDDSVAAARQATVDAMSALPSGYEEPEIGYDVPDSPRLEGWFDVNEYFSVLNHLSMQPGYTLDYVYHNSGSGAQPYLYARKIDATENYDYDYLAYVQTDDTEESFFQYIVLSIMGEQFYLWWHAAYNDYTIICDRTGLEAVLSDTYFDNTLPAEVQKEARRLDFAPQVEINNDTVTVRVVIFTKWGGFIEETYTITRAFPRIIEDIETKTLVEWSINITF